MSEILQHVKHFIGQSVNADEMIGGKYEEEDEVRAVRKHVNNIKCDSGVWSPGSLSPC
jgi:hypothetical protein